MKNYFSLGRLLLLLSGLSLALSSLYPETFFSMFCGWLATLTMVVGVKKSDQIKIDFFLSGFVFSLIAFYWLRQTLAYFGGFSFLGSLLLFILFSLTSALQFVVCGWIYARLAKSPLQSFCLALPLAWLVVEFFYPRLFPWMLAHSQVVWQDFAGLAEYCGVYPLSALMIWWAEAVACLFFRGFQGFSTCGAANKSKWLYPLSLASLSLIALSHLRNTQIENQLTQLPKLKVALVQGNLEAKQKRDLHYFDVNVDRYRELSTKAQNEGAELVVWPESIINAWTPEGRINIRGRKIDPFSQAKVPLIYGGLSFRESPANQSAEVDNEADSYLRFNSAFGIEADGTIIGNYHKRVLMPFGEYIPFASYFPELKSISPQTGDFTVGDILEPLTFPKVKTTFGELKVIAAALICYEDLIPKMSREAVALGANVLVNLTNDAWYGETAAPYQHQLLAQWRSIETRRYLLRVTNTGFTSVVNPLGRTVASLPIFSAGILMYDIELPKVMTLYSAVGDWPVWILSIACLFYSFVRRFD